MRRIKLIVSVLCYLFIVMPSINSFALDLDHGNPPKLDNRAVDGLNGVPDSLAYKVEEIERHNHNYERWFEVAAVPNGEIHVADPIGDNGGTNFQVDAGDDAWGSYIQVVGSSDTPAIAGSAYFDIQRFLISGSERTSIYFIQVVLGTSGAAGLAAGTYTELAFKPLTVQADSAPLCIQTRRAVVGTKVWIRIKCPGQNTGTLDFYYGLHEYEG